MNFVVRKSDLLPELQLFQGIVERKNTIPILANVLMEARGDAVEMVATDLEVGLRSRCPAVVEKEGSVTVPAKKLYEIIRSLPETEVRISEDKTGVRIAAESFESHLQTQTPQDFPAVPKPSGGPTVMLEAEAVRGMVAKTQFAITGEDTRFFLNGALLVLTPGEMNLVATDGHRLALVTVPRAKAGESNGQSDEIRAILPRKTLWELGKLLAEGEDGEIEYERGQNHLFFRVGQRMLVSRMIDGQFPAFERVIPKGNARVIQFDADRLSNAVRRVALLSNERSKAVKFGVEGGKVDVTSSSPEFGEARETIPVDYDDGDVQICFNAQYVLDFLNVVGTDQVTLQLKDDVSQAVMKPIGAEGYDYTYVIMPMRV